MPSRRVINLTRGVLLGTGGVVPGGSGDGGGGSGGGITWPAMPTTSPPGWVELTSTEFPKVVTAGNFASPTLGYGRVSTEISTPGNMIFNAYHPPAKDSRSKRSVTAVGAVSCPSTTLSGTSAICPSGPFVPSHTGRIMVGAGIPDLTTITYVSATEVTLSTAATSGTATATISEDYGFYDTDSVSVNANHELICPLYTAPATGRHHSVGLLPILHSNPFGLYGVRFTICLASDVIPGCKAVPLWWPDTGGSSNGGEMDQPETGLSATAKAAGFIHYDDASGQFTKGFAGSGAAAFVHLADGAPHTFVLEWLPNSATPALSNLKLFDDAIKTLDVTSIHVPHSNTMHLVVQLECEISDTVPIPPHNGAVRIKWIKIEVPA